ncbi:MAG: transcriptional regulator PpsR [Pseudomonadota bacterium]
MNKTGFAPARGGDFSALASPTVRALVGASSDFAVELSADLDVLALHRGAETLDLDMLEDLRGARFETTLTAESVPKFHALIEGALRGDPPRWRQLNHVDGGDEDIPVSYAAAAVDGDRLLLLGRDKREIAVLQKRLVQAQITIEQDYERIRQVESRYRVLFETGTDPLLILSADSGKIVDANSAAGRLLERDAVDLVNRLFANQLAAESTDAMAGLLETVRTKGGQKSVMLSLRSGNRQVWLDALLFRSVSDTLILCRLRSPTDTADGTPTFHDALIDLYDRSGDAVVFTDKDGAILRANPAFQALTNVAVPDRLVSENLAAFLGRPSVDLDVMTQNAERAGRMAVYGTTLRTEYGSHVPVEISTTYLPEQQPPGFAFILRDVTRLEASRQQASAVSTEAVEHVIELVGSTPLKELVRSTTDVVEKLCIETAIRLTSNNRAAAAEMLGLSRQSLYVKLRRFGLVDQDQEE